MSDEDVIKKFSGDGFEADGSFQCKDPTKVEWFPPAGTKLKVKMIKNGTKVGAKIRLDLAPNTFFQGKQAIEAATYLVNGDTLVNAEKLVFQPGLIADETVVMTTDPKTTRQVMLHKVKFGDGVEGDWTCPDKS
jgi:hypothetical protein